jgi:hypothetical protein
MGSDGTNFLYLNWNGRIQLPDREVKRKNSNIKSSLYFKLADSTEDKLPNQKKGERKRRERTVMKRRLYISSRLIPQKTP